MQKSPSGRKIGDKWEFYGYLPRIIHYLDIDFRHWQLSIKLYEPKTYMFASSSLNLLGTVINPPLEERGM